VSVFGRGLFCIVFPSMLLKDVCKCDCISNKIIDKEQKGMKFRNFRKDMRAISPVIATLLMIAVAVVASLVAYAWVMGYIGFQTTNTGKSIQIQSLSNSATGHTGVLTVYVQNIGDSQISLNDKSVYINGTLATDQTSFGDLPAQSTATLYTTNTVASGDTVTVKVTTTSGTFSEITREFP
jgi:archaeal type IV pilus assembly protein PilA